MAIDPLLSALGGPTGMLVGGILIAASLGGCADDPDPPSRPTETAPAAIEPQRGIGAARLGMTRASIRRALGDPARQRRFSAADSGTPIVTWAYPGRGLEVELRGGSVGLVATTSGRHRTSEGVGVGSTERELSDRLPGIRCSAGEPGTRSCVLGGTEPAQRQTLFELRDGRVRRVVVTLVY